MGFESGEPELTSDPVKRFQYTDINGKLWRGGFSRILSLGEGF